MNKASEVTLIPLCDYSEEHYNKKTREELLVELEDIYKKYDLPRLNDEEVDSWIKSQMGGPFCFYTPESWYGKSKLK